MDELMDMMVDDSSPSQISDKIKDLLYAKSAEKVDDYKTAVSNSLFGDQETEEPEASAEVEVEDEETEEEEV
tara:strand:- start:1570 stop:1785 length:216 start_codon:yes stop_codon:yes gene_type:complete